MTRQNCRIGVAGYPHPIGQYVRLPKYLSLSTCHSGCAVTKEEAEWRSRCRIQRIRARAMAIPYL
jgi:hypothetical protein